MSNLCGYVRVGTDRELEAGLGFGTQQTAHRVLFTTSEAEEEHLGDNPTDPARSLIRRVVGAVDDNERSMIALRRSYAGHGKRQAQFVRDRPPPLGFRDAGPYSAQSAIEREILSRISELRAEFRSLREIAAALTPEAIEPGSRDNRPARSLRLIVNRVEGHS